MFVGLVQWRVKKAEEEKLRPENGEAGAKTRVKKGRCLGGIERVPRIAFSVFDCSFLVL